MRHRQKWVTAGYVITHLYNVDGTGDTDWLADMATRINQHDRWVLQRIPLSRFHFGDGRDDRQIEAYAAMPAKTSPPIVAVLNAKGRYETIDGEHRLQAAYVRGDKTIRAYVPLP